MIKLKEKDIDLLKNCLVNFRPDLLYVVYSKDLVVIDSILGNELRQAVGNEFCREGLKPDSEPNEYGLELESLIDEIGRLFM
jgi:hypothetical protein